MKDYDEFLIKSNLWIQLVIPEIGTREIEITKEDWHKIDYFVYVKQIFWKSYNEKQNCWISLKEVPEIKKISEYKKQFNQLCFLNEGIESSLEKKKSEYCIKYSVEVSKTLDSFIQFLLDSQSRPLNDHTLIQSNCKVIKNYPWSSSRKAVRLFEKWKNKAQSEIWSIGIELSSSKSNSLLDKIAIVSEHLYGSFWKWWTLNDDTREDYLTAKYQIQKRHNAIKYSVENILLMEKSNSSFCKDLFKFLHDEINRSNINHYNKPVIGFYSGAKIDKQVINSFPFDILWDIDSTIARIITLKKWNEISSCPLFMRQRTFKDLFRFAVKGFADFYSKYNVLLNSLF